MSSLGTIVDMVLKCLPVPVALKFARGRTRISRHLPDNIQTSIDYYYGDFRINVDTNYPVEREMISGNYEPLLTRILESVITCGSVCIDIGANVGALTLVMSKLTGPSGIVYAFEPGPSTFNRLQANIVLNKLTNVTPVRVGLGERKEVLGWRMDRLNPGNAGLTRGAEFDELIDVTTLDSFIESQSVQSVDLLKVDVEGMEFPVFLGGQKTLETFRPTILLETLQTSREKRLQEGNDLYTQMEAFLRRTGYLLFRIDGDGRCRETSLQNTSEDTLAIHSTRRSVLEKFQFYSG